MAIFAGLSRKSRGRLAAWIETKLQGQSLKSHGDGGVAPRPRPLPNECDTCDIMYNYIPHPSNMRTTDQVLAMRIAEGAAGYGIYMMLLELLRDAEGRSLVSNPAHLAFAINEQDVDLVKRVVQDYGLFTLSDDGKFSSPWLEAAMDEYDAKKAAAREAGRRGAAKRYGKVPDQAPDMTKDENPEQEPYGGPIGGGMATPCPTDSNITQPTLFDKQTNETNQSKSKLLSLSWGSLDGQALFDLARKEGPALAEEDEQYARQMDKRLDGGYNKTYYAAGVFSMARYFRLTSPMFHFLLELTHNGHRGTEAYARLRSLKQHCEKTKFTPQFPAEYVLVKMLENGKK